MRDFRDAKAMATSLRQALSDKSVTFTHSESLELVSKAFGFDNWNILAARIEAEPRPKPLPEPAEAGGDKTLYCSFCGKSQHEVTTLIAGPKVLICSGCVGLCDGILLDGRLGKLIEEAKSAGGDGTGAALETIRGFDSERLSDWRRSEADWLEHLEWGLSQTAAALAGEPLPLGPDETAERRRRMGDPPWVKSREQILKQKAHLEGREPQVRQRLSLIDQVLRERGIDPGQGPNASA